MRLRDVGRFACRAPVLFMKRKSLWLNVLLVSLLIVCVSFTDGVDVRKLSKVKIIADLVVTGKRCNPIKPGARFKRNDRKITSLDVRKPKKS